MSILLQTQILVNCPSTTTSPSVATFDIDCLPLPAVHRQKLQYFHILNLTIRLSLSNISIVNIFDQKKRESGDSLYQYYFPNSEHRVYMKRPGGLSIQFCVVFNVLPIMSINSIQSLIVSKLSPITTKSSSS